MTPEQRRQYQLEWQRRLSGVEKRWKGKVYIALQHQIKFFVSYIERNGLVDAKLNLQYQLPSTGIATVLQALYINAGLFQANVSYGETRKLKYRGFGHNEEWTKAIVEYFKLHLLNKAVLPITDTTKDMIRGVLERATEEGWSVDETVNEILRKGKEVNAKRARVIVRTESVRAMNVGTLLGADKSNLVLEKQWIAAHDERTRNTHRLNDGKQVDMEDTFPNGLAFPGDPNGSAKETINCRCTIALVPKRDEHGRLIRKPMSLLAPNSKPPALSQITEGIANGLMIGNLINELVNE